jgi:hypothetical protein
MWFESEAWVDPALADPSCPEVGVICAGGGRPLRERAGSFNHFEPAHSVGAGMEAGLGQGRVFFCEFYGNPIYTRAKPG